LNKIPDVKATLQDLSTRGFSATRGFPIEFTVRGQDWGKLVECSGAIQKKMKESNLFVDVDTDYLEGMPEVRIALDRDKALERGVSVQDITDVITPMMAGDRVGKYTKNGKRYDVRVKVIPQKRVALEDIQKLKTWNNRGEEVRLGDVIVITQQDSLLSITRRDRERAIGIFANPAPGKSLATALKSAEEIGRGLLPEGYRMVFSGTSKTFQESFSSLSFALWCGILIAYMVLASQFNHVIHPFTVLLALPFSVTGAVLALLIGNQSLNIYSMIGLILLFGIVKKNSILLVEFTNQMRRKGLDPLEALKAACPIRLRPIIMTSFATIAGALPAALAWGAGSELIKPMGIAVIGGVILSTLLTLFVVPAAYLSLVRLEKRETYGKLLGWGNRWLGRLKVYASGKRSLLGRRFFLLFLLDQAAQTSHLHHVADVLNPLLILLEPALDGRLLLPEHLGRSQRVGIGNPLGTRKEYVSIVKPRPAFFTRHRVIFPCLARHPIVKQGSQRTGFDVIAKGNILFLDQHLIERDPGICKEPRDQEKQKNQRVIYLLFHDRPPSNYLLFLVTVISPQKRSSAVLRTVSLSKCETAYSRALSPIAFLSSKRAATRRMAPQKASRSPGGAASPLP